MGWLILVFCLKCTLHCARNLAALLNRQGGGKAVDAHRHLLFFQGPQQMRAQLRSETHFPLPSTCLSNPSPSLAAPLFERIKPLLTFLLSQGGNDLQAIRTFTQWIYQLPLNSSLHPNCLLSGSCLFHLCAQCWELPLRPNP